MTPAWLRAAVLAEPAAHPLPVVAAALPEARLSGPPDLAWTAHEVLSAESALVRTGVLGLAGPASPLPAGLAQELARLPAGSAAAGLVGAIEDRLLRLLVASVRRRPADDPAAQRARLQRLAGPLADGEHAVAGRLVDGRTADALAHRLAALCSCAVQVSAATGGRLPTGPGTGNALGRHRLGEGQVLGETVSSPEFGCRIAIGPVDAALAGRLRPGGDLRPALLAAVARGLPPCISACLVLLVRAGPGRTVGQAVLGVDSRLDGQQQPVEAEPLA